MSVDLLCVNNFLYKMKEEILKIFGNRIRELRLQSNLSQEQLAELTDFHRTYISMIERGERNISLINIQRFANAFDLSINELLNSI